MALATVVVIQLLVDVTVVIVIVLTGVAGVQPIQLDVATDATHAMDGGIDF